MVKVNCYQKSELKFLEQQTTVSSLFVSFPFCVLYLCRRNMVINILMTLEPNFEPTANQFNTRLHLVPIQDQILPPEVHIYSSGVTPRVISHPTRNHRNLSLDLCYKESMWVSSADINRQESDLGKP